MISGIRADVARMIHEREAFKTGAFKLKLHEKNPDAPLSPFYINLRTPDNPKPGPLLPADCKLVSDCLLQVAKENKIVFDDIAGIPNAATPFVSAMDWEFLASQGVGVILLGKEEKDGMRKIVPLPGFTYKKGTRILLFDDLVTQADTKFEAIKAIEDSGGIVEAIIILVDRQQGGKQALQAAGYKVFCAFTIRELFSFYLQINAISKEKFMECMRYLKVAQLA